MGLRPAKSHEKLDAFGGACFSGVTGDAGLNKEVPPKRRQFALVNHWKQMGAQMSLPAGRKAGHAWFFAPVFVLVRSRQARRPVPLCFTPFASEAAAAAWAASPGRSTAPPEGSSAAPSSRAATNCRSPGRDA